MRFDKIGTFIVELRKEKGYTQEELASKIPITRQAVSKWERNITIPDPNSLDRLCKIFEVSIDELFYGERKNTINKDNINKITLNLYKDKRKSRKIIFLLIMSILSLMLCFLLYYLYNSYKSIYIYSISGISENGEKIEGEFINTNNKIILLIDDITISNLQELNLYYINESGYKIDIYKGNDNSIKIIDYKGYDEYLDSKNISYIINNMFIHILLENNKFEDIKLNFREDFVNDDLIFKQENKIDKKGIINDNVNISDNYKNIIENIKKNYKKNDNIYTYSKNKKTINYNDELNMVTLSYTDENNDLLEFWQVFLINDCQLFYSKYDSKKIDYEFSIDMKNMLCMDKICEEHYEKINEFWEELTKSFK